MKRMSIKEKLLLVFSLLIIFLTVLFGKLFYQLRTFAVKQVYNDFERQADYYVRQLEYRLEQIMHANAGFFSGRQLVFLADERILDAYERREALLSVQENLNIIKLSDSLIKEISLFIPATGRIITTDAFMDFQSEKAQEFDSLIADLQKLSTHNGEVVYCLSEVPYSKTRPPHFYTKLVLDNVKIVQSLNDLTPEEGGVCWYNEKLNWFVEDSKGMGIATQIVEKIEEGEHIQKAKFDGKAYLVNVTKSEYYGLLIQYCSQRTVLSGLENYTTVFGAFVIITIICALMFSGYTETLVNKPIKKIQAAFYKLKQGDMHVRIKHSSLDEFNYIYVGFNDMVAELNRMINEVYIQKQLVAQAELKQLQAQINPHFLYNSFFLFSGRIRKKDYEGANALAEYLGKYFLYLTRNGSDVIRMEEEYGHAESYARIQECRFHPRILLNWEELPAEVKDVMVPRLIIQPILENAYKYGLEDMEEDGLLHVWSQVQDNTLHIFIENNGNVSEGTIEAIQNKLKTTYAGEVTGLVNIHRRLQIFSGENSGIEVSRKSLGGMLIDLRISLKNK